METSIEKTLIVAAVALISGFLIGHTQGLKEKIKLEQEIINAKFLYGYSELSKLLASSRELLSKLHIDLGNLTYSGVTVGKTKLLESQKQINDFLLKSDYDYNKNLKDCAESRKQLKITSQQEFLK